MDSSPRRIQLQHDPGTLTFRAGNRRNVPLRYGLIPDCDRFYGLIWYESRLLTHSSNALSPADLRREPPFAAVAVDEAVTRFLTKIPCIALSVIMMHLKV